MKQINNRLKEQIKEKIAFTEKMSSCEFVAIMTQKSGNYQIYAFFYATLSALLIPHLFLWMSDWFSAYEILHQQIMLFILLMFLTQLSFVTNNLVPSAIKERQASLVAAKSFRKFGLHKTSKRRAILFFISIDEKYVEIITDVGIDEKIPSLTWQTIIENFRLQVISNNLGEGYLEAIEACGEILKREFPVEEGDVDELTNELIIDTSL